MRFDPSENRERVAHFHQGGRLIPLSVYGRALALIGDAPIVATFVERSEGEERSGLTVWVLLEQSLVRVRCAGRKGWDESLQTNDPEEASSQWWPLSRVVTVAGGEFKAWRGFAGEVSWQNQLVLDLGSEQLAIPSSLTDEHTTFYQQELDEFLALLMASVTK